MARLTKVQKQKCRRLRVLATLLSSDTQNEDEDLLALLLARMATRQPDKIPRGPYDGVQSVDFFDKLMNSFTPRVFRTFVR